MNYHKQIKLKIVGSFLLILLLCNGLLFAQSITLQLVKEIKPPTNEWSEGMAYIMHNTGEDGPAVAVVWYKKGYYAQCYFYDANMNYLTKFYTSTLHQGEFKGDCDNEMIMNVTSGDVDNDGINEIAIIARVRDFGLYLVRWNSSKGDLDYIWRHEGPPCIYRRGLAIGNFSPQNGKEVVFGDEGGELILLDKNKNQIATTNLNGKGIQNIRVADMDGNGYDEMYIATGRRPGEVWKVKYENDSLHVGWHTNVTQISGTGINCYEIWSHPNGNPDGGWGIGGASEQEGDIVQGSMFIMDKNGKIKWQKIHPSDAPRAGGAGFGDITGDGKPEVITRGAVGSFGACVIIRDNSGALLCKQGTGNSAAPNGPFLFDYQNDGKLELIVGGNSLKIYKIIYEASADTKSNNTKI